MMTSLGNGINIDMVTSNGFHSVADQEISEWEKGMRKREAKSNDGSVMWSFAHHKRRRATNIIMQHVLVIGYFVSKYGCMCVCV